MKTVAEHRCRASNSERSRCHFANFPEPKVFNRFSKQELWNETDKYSLHFYVLCLRTRVAGAVASKIGRASCRERVKISVVGVALKERPVSCHTYTTRTLV